MKCKHNCLRQQTNFRKLFSSLNLFEDSQNTLRLKERSDNSLLKYDRKYPIMLLYCVVIKTYLPNC